MENTEKQENKLQILSDKIKMEKITEVAVRKDNTNNKKLLPHYLCFKGLRCKKCGFYLEKSCKGCDHLGCISVVCARSCHFDLKQYCVYERCGNMAPKYMEKDEHELMSYDFSEIIRKIKPTKPLNLPGKFIPGVGPFGKSAPGEILKFPEHYVDADDASGYVMVPANQLPIVTPNADRPEDITNPEKIFLRDVDLRDYLGIQPETKMILNFRALDDFLMFFWARMIYDRENFGYQTLFKQIDDYGFDYCVNINFSMWDKMSVYQNLFNLKRQLISFVELQKYFGDRMIMEYNDNPLIPQVEELYYKIFDHCGISTIHLNYQIGIDGVLKHATRGNLGEKIKAKEIILGGISSPNLAQKFALATGLRHKFYVSNMTAYVGTVFQQHIAGYKYQKPIPPSEDEEGRAAYYSELYRENCIWMEDQLTRLLPEKKEEVK